MGKPVVPVALNRKMIQQGFTLLEMSIVLVIISVVMVGVMTVFTDSLAVRQMRNTTDKMKAIQIALYDYRVAKKRIPCPADLTLPITDTNFGVEDAGPGSCATGTAPVANFNQATASTTGNTTNASAVITSIPSTALLSIGMGVTGNGIPAGDIIKQLIVHRKLRWFLQQLLPLAG